MIATINPATGETVETFEPIDELELELALEEAATAFPFWRETPFSERGDMLRNAAEILEREFENFARLMTLEMGKPIAQARAEAKKCALVCRYYADHGEEHLASISYETEAATSYVRHDPLGIVLAVMPWNFPFWQVFRFAAPSLMAGNVGLLKHASNVPQCALAIEDILHRAGFDHGRFRTLLATSDQMRSIVEDDRVSAVTLTGSEGAGSSVASAAGGAIKKVVLELGGSDPFIVMPSADLELAVRTAVTARVQNGGQSCIAAKRFIVHQEISNQFTAKFAAAMDAVVIGDPRDDTTQLGPLATPQILDEVHELVEDAVAGGARILTGGTRLDQPGNYYKPTVMIDIPYSTRLFREEVFGPVASIYTIPDVDHAVELANATDFGLAASVWTQDEREQGRFIKAIDAGQVFVNAMVASDPRLPFGGVKKSGFGRELGPHGIKEFVNAKTVWVAKEG